MRFVLLISELIRNFNLTLKGVINTLLFRGLALRNPIPHQNPLRMRVLSFLNDLVFLLISPPGQIPDSSMYPAFNFDIKFRPGQSWPGSFLLSKRSTRCSGLARFCYHFKNHLT